MHLGEESLNMTHKTRIADGWVFNDCPAWQLKYKLITKVQNLFSYSKELFVMMEMARTLQAKKSYSSIFHMDLRPSG